MATSTPPSPPVSDTTPGDEGSFLDKPFNMATFVVLPIMILVYGGCCVIYCIAKGHSYCKQKISQQQEDSDQTETNENSSAGNSTCEADRKTKGHGTERSDSALNLNALRLFTLDLTARDQSPSVAPTTTQITDSARNPDKGVLAHTIFMETTEDHTKQYPMDPLSDPRVTPARTAACGRSGARQTGRWKRLQKMRRDTIKETFREPRDVSVEDVEDTSTCIFPSEDCVPPARPFVTSRPTRQGLTATTRARYSRDVKQQMKHLDQQLRVAFQLISHHSLKTSDPGSKQRTSSVQTCGGQDGKAKRPSGPGRAGKTTRIKVKPVKRTVETRAPWR